MWSLPGWETEALAARAVCSMALCLRSAASQPLRSLPTYSTLPVGRWQKPGECQIIKYLAMPHPIANLTEEQLDQRARDIVPQIVDILLGKHLPHS